jgi:hypothetical protein
MHYVIEGIIGSFEKLIEIPAYVFKKQYDIDVMVNTHAERIDRVNQEIHSINLKK